DPDPDMAPLKQNIVVHQFKEKVQVNLPIRVSSLPAGADLDAGTLSGSIEGPDGQIWRFVGDASLARSPAAFSRLDDGRYLVKLQVDASFFDQVKSEPVTLSMSLNLNLFKDEGQATIPDHGSFEVPTIGFCGPWSSSGISYSGDVHRPVICLCALRPPSRIVVRAQDPHDTGDTFSSRSLGDLYSPYPAEFGLSPLATTGVLPPLVGRDTKLVIVAQRRISHVSRDVGSQGLRLADYKAE